MAEVNAGILVNEVHRSNPHYWWAMYLRSPCHPTETLYPPGPQEQGPVKWVLLQALPLPGRTLPAKPGLEPPSGCATGCFWGVLGDRTP